MEESCKNNDLDAFFAADSSFHRAICRSCHNEMMYIVYDAIEYLLTGHKVDLVLLDYDMPVMTGPQVLETLRHNPKISQTPVMFLTGKSDRKSVINVVNLKPDGYILKSSGRDDILASLFKFFKTHNM